MNSPVSNSTHRGDGYLAPHTLLEVLVNPVTGIDLPEIAAADISICKTILDPWLPENP